MFAVVHIVRAGPRRFLYKVVLLPVRDTMLRIWFLEVNLNFI